MLETYIAVGEFEPCMIRHRIRRLVVSDSRALLQGRSIDIHFGTCELSLPPIQCPHNRHDIPGNRDVELPAAQLDALVSDGVRILLSDIWEEQDGVVLHSPQ